MKKIKQTTTSPKRKKAIKLLIYKGIEGMGLMKRTEQLRTRGKKVLTNGFGFGNIVEHSARERSGLNLEN